MMIFGDIANNLSVLWPCSDCVSSLMILHVKEINCLLNSKCCGVIVTLNRLDVENNWQDGPMALNGQNVGQPILVVHLGIKM